MAKLSDLVSDFIAVQAPMRREPELSHDESKLYRSLKTQGERAVRGVDVGKHVFEARESHGNVFFRMVVEGRQSDLVSRQMARRFLGHEGVDSVEITRDGRRSVLTLVVKR